MGVVSYAAQLLAAISDVIDEWDADELTRRSASKEFLAAMERLRMQVSG